MQKISLMFRFRPLLLLISFFAPLTAAMAASIFPGEKVSTTRDVWGHRPGARGFSTVILDAGHGGKDAGATSRVTGQREKDLALDMVRRVRRELSGAVRTVLTRNSDTFVELDDRVRIADGTRDAVLVSIHFNSGRSRLAGPEVFYWRVDSYTLGRRIQAALSHAAPEKRGNRGLARRRLRLTRNPQIACVLVECGYISHGSEARLIAKPEYRSRLAKAIAGAILDQRAEGDAGLGSLPKPIYARPSRGTDHRE
jgi:N-acetylmuramoyl-L-alanine amidase